MTFHGMLLLAHQKHGTIWGCGSLNAPRFDPVFPPEGGLPETHRLRAFMNLVDGCPLAVATFIVVEEAAVASWWLSQVTTFPRNLPALSPSTQNGADSNLRMTLSMVTAAPLNCVGKLV